MNSLLRNTTLYVSGKAVGRVSDVGLPGITRDRLGQPGALRDAPKQGAAPEPAPRKGIGVGPS